MEQKTATVQIGAKKVVLVELSVEDSMAVDPYVPFDTNGVPNGIVLSKVYAIASVREIDGVPVNGCGGLVQWRRVLGQFTAMESFDLSREYQIAFGGVESLETKFRKALDILNHMDAADPNVAALSDVLTIKPMGAGVELKNVSSDPA